MRKDERQLIAQYFQDTSALLTEIRHHVYRTPEVPLPESLGERANIILSYYADHVKRIKQIMDVK
jgi:hypothetical protein